MSNVTIYHKSKIKKSDMNKAETIYKQKLLELQALAPFLGYGYAKEVLSHLTLPRKYKIRTVYAVKRGDRRNEHILDALLIVGRNKKAEWQAMKD